MDNWKATVGKMDKFGITNVLSWVNAIIKVNRNIVKILVFLNNTWNINIGCSHEHPNDNIRIKETTYKKQWNLFS